MRLLEYRNIFEKIVKRHDSDVKYSYFLLVIYHVEFKKMTACIEKQNLKKMQLFCKCAMMMCLNRYRDIVRRFMDLYDRWYTNTALNNFLSTLVTIKKNYCCPRESPASKCLGTYHSKGHQFVYFKLQVM